MGLGWWQLRKICLLKDREKYLCKELCCIWFGAARAQRKFIKLRTESRGVLLSRAFPLTNLTAGPRTKQNAALSSLKFLAVIFSRVWIPVVKTKMRKIMLIYREFSVWSVDTKGHTLKVPWLAKVPRHYCPVGSTAFPFLEIQGDTGVEMFGGFFKALYSALIFLLRRAASSVKTKNNRSWLCLCCLWRSEIRHKVQLWGSPALWECVTWAQAEWVWSTPETGEELQPALSLLKGPKLWLPWAGVGRQIPLLCWKLHSH